MRIGRNGTSERCPQRIRRGGSVRFRVDLSLGKRVRAGLTMSRSPRFVSMLEVAGRDGVGESISVGLEGGRS